MPAAELVEEAARQMTICNACRYCEGFCAVFPAMELRTTFSKGDVTYLANLCFDCRACYYACQFAPPHEYNINVPRVFAQLRSETYRDYQWPNLFRSLFTRSGLAVGAITAVALVVVLGLLFAFQRPELVLSTHVGEGAFYAVIPEAAMVIPASAMVLYGVIVFLMGATRFWRDTRANPADLIDFGAFLASVRDAFGMRYMQGGGYGCNYPSAGFSHSRRVFHHLVFYGFLLDLASTTIAAIYEHVFGWISPYPFLSAPVILGTVGGIGLSIGTVGLLVLKWRSDRMPAEETMVTMDVAFLVLLFFTALTGLLLLVLRETPAMGLLLAVHLAMVAGFFITAPYGKFAHVVYRYTALVRNSVEQRRV